MKHVLSIVSILVCGLFLLPNCSDAETKSFPRADGYQGVWYSNQPSKDKYVYKYSGGLGTYCAKHFPHAQYAPEADKTFFVFGGTKGLGEETPLLIMASYYDHETGMVPKPVIVMEKGTEDAHHNPAICIDDKGIIWIFASAHGGNDGFIWKSDKPYSIDSFSLVCKKPFTYPQPRFMEGEGIQLLFTKYTGGRESYISTSIDNFDPAKDRKLVGFGGHYQISGKYKNKRGTAWNWHPPKGGLNARTNLYYMESTDFGKTWQTVDGEKLQIPLDSSYNPAMVREYQKEGLLVYMKDIDYDKKGNPVILYILSRGYESGPDNGARIWMCAHWSGKEWQYKKVAESDHNYDMGSLYIEDDGVWRVIAPILDGPQEYCTGGEMVMLLSEDSGATWKQIKQLTSDSPRNHTYARRPVNANPDFYAFWADGDALKPSISQLYFTDKEGSGAYLLPPIMKSDFESPILIKQ